MGISKTIRFVVFLSLNFLALIVGVWLMNDGPQTNWYQSLNKAPWTPASWVFGVAWFFIMFCFSFYMTNLSFKFKLTQGGFLIAYLYMVQWILNVMWNYFFFNQHYTVLGLIIIIGLWLLIGYFTIEYCKKMKAYTLLILPYLVWMTIATSLNAYVVFNN
ncbi:TspO/MBR family protein [uncultured Tenacibaculum sp.]|uniref:TspO/MBR family protein n=1 Tax=uncultured Tenacibaculum sp. TaxID=174713 RepID=UPI00261331B7|nr:TspO/MBR family protein [uncultured Tenacibaculum sp.]